MCPNKRVRLKKCPLLPPQPPSATLITRIRGWESTHASWAAPGMSRILEEGGGQTQPATSKTHSPTGLELANYLGCTSASSWSGPAHGLPSGVAQKAQYRQTCCRPLERPRFVCACACACVCVCVCVCVIPLSPPNSLLWPTHPALRLLLHTTPGVLG